MSTIISKREFKRRKNLRDREYQKNKYQEKLRADGKVSEKDKIVTKKGKNKRPFGSKVLSKKIYVHNLNISKRIRIYVIETF